MNPVKRLFGQTAVYGIPAIVARLINWLLVPIYTRAFTPDQYGVVTELYAYAVILQILLTYGMETGFFRFSEKNYTADKVFSTSFTSLFSTSSLFIFTVILFSKQIADFLGYSNHVEYIIYFAIILGTDAVSAIFFARLRQQNKAFKFAALKTLNILLNVGFNLYFIVFCPYFLKSHPGSVLCHLYNPNIGVGYIFISNLIASVTIFILFLPTIFKIRYSFSLKLWLKILGYSLPLLITGLTGAINEVADRIMLKFLTTVPPGTPNAHEYVMYQLGIYGANAKIAVIMMLFVQAFRYAAEPFYFSYAKEHDSHQVFADVMKYYTMLAVAILLFVMLYLDIIKFMIDPKYFQGLDVVFPLLLSRMLVGVFFLLSFWYKLTDRTHYGMVIFAIGAVITLTLNYIFIPKFGYIACAWTNFTTYLTMVTISFLWGRKYLPIKYELKELALYLLVGFAILLIFKLAKPFYAHNFIIKYAFATVLLVSYLAFVTIREKLWKLLPEFLQLKK